MSNGKLSIKTKSLFGLTSIVIILTSIFFNFSSIKNILLGVYKWHSLQPETTQGSAVLIILFIIVFSLLLSNIRKTNFIILVLALIYLQLQHVLLPAVSALIYLEILISIGFFIKNIFSLRVEIQLSSYVQAFILGFVTWATLAIISSLLGYGGFSDLRILTLVLGLLSLYKKKTNLMTYYIYDKLAALNKTQKFMFSFVYIMILTQLAKTNRALDYDSLWYGLRPEHVLVGEHSFFDNLNLVMAVHYYPKLFELYTIPLGNLGDYSFILSGNIMLYTMLLIAAYVFTNYVANIRITTLAILLLASTPALANMASTAKPDVFSALFISCCAFYLWKWLETRDLLSLSLGLSCAIISLGGKLTSLMYTPLFIIGILLIYIFKGVRQKEWRLCKELRNKNLAIFSLSTSIFVLCLICYRTIKLTGYPFFPVFQKMWILFGFKANYPFLGAASDYVVSDNKHIFSHWYNIAFNPMEFIHYVMVWPSNAYLFMWILSFFIIVFNLRKKKLDLSFYLAIVPVCLSGVYYISSFPQGGDGNYYIPVVIFTIIAFMVLINQLSDHLRKVICVSLLLFVPVQSCIMMVSHFSWSWGTSKFSLDITESNFDTKSYKKEIFLKNGMNHLEEYLSEHNNDSNCISFLKTDGQEQVLNQLSCRHEDIQHMASRYGNSVLFQSEDDFKNYLQWAKIDTIILPKQRLEEETFKSVYKVINELKKMENSEIIEDTEFELVRFKLYK
ncbi:hypothetical protein [Paenibacillus silagei]|uniref:Glycosyltransferase RgtA/B/C/D-like domain-containing protein n=1 Tax=Paenibacillus silagei TaxID=1670801 RepID=A0ABS4NIL9_9BACL|nr:hypothetical protein [Paenibacillus silagei]MBP2109883.1 hypothetical protein [Paenibacillus silagei]